MKPYVHVNICHPYEVECYQHFEVPCIPLEDFIVIALNFKHITLCPFMVLPHMYTSSPKMLPINIYLIFLLIRFR